MSIIATAKNKAFKGNATKGNVKEAFKNEEGAIDLASIMVGIIVIGLIGGVIAATVFAVIPWAQDNAAKQQLDSVAAAQSAYIGLASETSAIKFGNATELNTAKLFDATAAKVSLATAGSGDSAHYGAAVVSSSGKVWYITDAKTKPTEAANAAAAKTAVETAVKVGVTPVPATIPWTGQAL